MTLLFALLSCSGLTFIFKYGSIFKWVREPLCRIIFFKELFSCSLCLGFWSGIVVALFLYSIDRDILVSLLPFASAAFSWFADCMLRVIQTYETLLDKKIEKK